MPVTPRHCLPPAKPARVPRHQPPVPPHIADQARLDMRDLIAVTKMCESTIRLMIARREFPAADYRMGRRCVRWSAGLVRQWLESTRTAAGM